MFHGPDAIGDAAAHRAAVLADRIDRYRVNEWPKLHVEERAKLLVRALDYHGNTNEEVAGLMLGTPLGQSFKDKIEETAIEFALEDLDGQ